MRTAVSALALIAALQAAPAFAQEGMLEGRDRPGTRPDLPDPVVQDNPGAVSAPPPEAFPTDQFPVPDRWRLAESIGVRERWWDPYNQNTLKGDRPILGTHDLFLSLTGVSDTVIEPRSFPIPVGNQTTEEPGSLDVFAASPAPTRWWQGWQRVRTPLRVVDRSGVVRLQRDDARAHACTVKTLEPTLRALLATLVDYGDAGRTLPDLHVLLGSRVLSLAGLADEGQAVGLAGVEARSCPAVQPLVIVAGPRM